MQRRICICEEASFYATIKFRRFVWSGNRTDRGILGVTFLCIGIGLHVGGRKKYLHFSNHCNCRGSAKKNGERT